MTTPDTILHFWFDELQPAQWWRVDAALDATIGKRFATVLDQALAGELQHWRESAEGRLAEIIVLDQFSRNIHRGTPRAFAADNVALVLAQEALRAQADVTLPPPRRAFLYMPFMHSESPRIHEQSIRLFDQPGLEGNLDAARRHKAIIDRFGRYPHRNAILGRPSSVEEEAFLQTPGSSF